MIPAQLVVDIFTCLADVAILVFFWIELKESKEDRKLREKQIVLLEHQLTMLSSKTTQEVELLEDVHAELADLNDKTPEISEEGQDESNTTRDQYGRQGSESKPVSPTPNTPTNTGS